MGNAIRRKYAFFVFMLFFLRPASGNAAEAEFDYAYKISVETRLEERLRSVISDIVPADKFIVIVNAELESAGRNDKSSRNETILPGVPYGILSQDSKQDKAPAEGRHRVKRLVVNILVDKGVPASALETLNEVAKNVIGYNLSRGDQLTVKHLNFGNGNAMWRAFFAPPNIYWLILLVMGGFFFLTAGLYLMNHPFKKLSTSLQKVNWEVALTGKENFLGGGAGSGSQTVIAGEGSQIVTKGDGDSERPFSFVSDKNLSDLAYLLKDSDATDIGIIMNYLEPELATQLLEQFSEEKQMEIALNLSNINEVSPEKTHELEKFVKDWLFYKVGGEDKAASILRLASDDLRDKVLKTIEDKDGSVAERMRVKAKSFEETIMDLPEPSMQVLYRQVNRVAFAQILKSSPEAIRQKALESLSEGASERLSEEIELSRSLSPERLKKEKQNVMAVIRRMADSGMMMEN